MTRDRLDAKQIQTHLNYPLTITIVKETTSTNDVAKKLLKEGKGGLLLIATNKQTAGRGRLGRCFYSELAHGLYFSLAFQPKNISMEEIPQYTILAATALVETLEAMTKKTLAIKWVNDIFYNGRKISGILSEMVSAKDIGVVVGIGINFAGDFTHTSKEVQAVAGTLFGKETPHDFNQNAFLQHFIERFFHYHQHFNQKAFLPIYEEHLLGIGETVEYVIQDKKYTGIILGINEQGHLMIQKPNGERDTLYSQEVHFSSAQFSR